jgi:hypothetical protein
MNPLMMTGLIGQGVLQGIQGGMSLAQGLKLDPGERPMYTGNERLQGMGLDTQIKAGGRMANIGAMERSAASNTAAASAGYNRAATDATQAFLGNAATNAQSSSNALQLAQIEAQDKARREGIAMNTQNMLVADERMAFQDKQQKYYEDVQTKQQLIAGGFAGLGGMFGTAAQIGQMSYMKNNELGPFNPNPYGYRGLGGGGGTQTPADGDIKIVDGVTFKYNAATNTYERT